MIFSENRFPLFRIMLLRTPSITFGRSPTAPSAVAGLRLGGEVDKRGQDRADDDPGQLIPIKERQAAQCRLHRVVEGRPNHRDELDDEQQVPPAPSAAPASQIIHNDCSSCVSRTRRQILPLRHGGPGIQHPTTIFASSFRLIDTVCAAQIPVAAQQEHTAYTAAVVTPPSTTMVWPVMKVEASEAR